MPNNSVQCVMRLTEAPALGLVRLHICLKKIKTQGCGVFAYLCFICVFKVQRIL